LVVWRGGRAGEVAEYVAWDVVWPDDVVFYKGKPRNAEEPIRVGPASGMIVVHPDDFVSVAEETHGKVRSEKAGRASDEVSH
jgi:hypothetical protein